MKKIPVKACLAEFLGTLTLALAVGLSIATKWPVMTPVVAGLTLGLFVYTIGGISGAQINPAVTIGLWSVKKMKTREAVSYLVAQILGGIGAMVLLKTLVVMPKLKFANMPWTIFAEALGAFFLVFGVSAVVHKKVENAAAGLTIGGSLLLGILMASKWSLGVLNPGVAIGLGGLASWAYLLAPIVGGVIAAQLYNYLQSK